MSTCKPKVSIGLPVYNGENFLRQAIESILSQSFENFELIICDNDSTDSTEEICKYYQQQDSRVKYYRNSENLGAARNYNRTFELSSGEYFKWAAHDDLCHPEFLEKCVDVLDKDPSTVLAYSQCDQIDGKGQKIREWKTIPKSFSENDVSKRFKEAINEDCWVLVFGLIRSNVLAKTPLLGSFEMHDWVLLAELALHGAFKQVPEVLFSYRFHPEQFTTAVWNGDQAHDSIAWFDTQKIGKLRLPYWQRAYEHIRSSMRVPATPKETLARYVVIVEWMLRSRGYLKQDMLHALKRTTGLKGSAGLLTADS